MEPTLMLKFATEGLNLHDKSALISDIFKEITQTINVTDIIGLQLIPKQWSHHVEILCANEATKDILLNNGLKIQNQDIKIYETGLNKVKVAIDNAPLNMDNGIIKEALCEFGKVLDIRNEYLSVGGKRVPWWNGTRHVDMSHLKCELPPTLKLHIGEKEIKVRVWHIGQTEQNVAGARNMSRTSTIAPNDRPGVASTVEAPLIKRRSVLWGKCASTATRATTSYATAPTCTRRRQGLPQRPHPKRQM